MNDLFMRGSAVFSPCERYRYSLLREWDDELPRIAYIMLNPSTATAEVSDPTVTRCLRWSQRNGYGSMEVLNLFALRSTDPKALYREPDPIGPENDRYIREGAAVAAKVICAWGNHGKYLKRGEHVVNVLHGMGVKADCFRTTDKGHPYHPLYLPKDISTIRFV